MGFCDPNREAVRSNGLSALGGGSCAQLGVSHPLLERPGCCQSCACGGGDGEEEQAEEQCEIAEPNDAEIADEGEAEADDVQGA